MKQIQLSGHLLQIDQSLNLPVNNPDSFKLHSPNVKQNYLNIGFGVNVQVNEDSDEQKADEDENSD